MYAEKTKDENGNEKYNLMQLTEPQVGLLELGLSCIHLNTKEKYYANQLWQQIDKELSE